MGFQLLDDVTQSETANTLYDVFEAKYGDLEHVVGTFVQDTVRLGNIQMEAVQFGRATFSEYNTKVGQIDTVGIMGVGVNAMEFQSAVHNATPDPNIVSELVAHGVINTNAFSLYLNSLGKIDVVLAFMLPLTASEDV